VFDLTTPGPGPGQGDLGPRSPGRSPRSTPWQSGVGGTPKADATAPTLRPSDCKRGSLLCCPASPAADALVAEPPISTMRPFRVTAPSGDGVGRPPTVSLDQVSSHRWSWSLASGDELGRRSGATTTRADRSRQQKTTDSSWSRVLRLPFYAVLSVRLTEMAPAGRRAMSPIFLAERAVAPLDQGHRADHRSAASTGVDRTAKNRSTPAITTRCRPHFVSPPPVPAAHLSPHCGRTSAPN